MSPEFRWSAVRGALVLLGAGLTVFGCGVDYTKVDRRHETLDPTLAEQPQATNPPDISRPAEAGRLTCTPVESSDKLPARTSALTRPTLTTVVGMNTDDLFQQFQSQCGGCHVDQGQGGFQVKRPDFAKPLFADRMAESLRRIRSDAAGTYMPPAPTGKPFKDRPAGDPVRAFADLLDAWTTAGRPDDVFYPNAATGASSGQYLFTKEMGEQFTNLGNCIPSVDGFASEEKVSRELDAKFAAMKTLPLKLNETDLTTFDSKELARFGVVAFAPAYTLWADNAKKQRLVRVPRGESIRFDPDTQNFVIPPNTRFYKTFFKKVIDKQGKTAWRKMETRLIVARPDDPAKSGVDAPMALFGTYAWNDDETEAELVRDPRRDGSPFRDRLTTFYIDEKRVEELVRAGTKDINVAVAQENLARHYAIPGSDRCIQCHMGSPSQSFILGFAPLQIRRRAGEEGGVSEDEPAGRDELNQFQRLIDYGVISGLTSPEEVKLLEESQGSREPRNDYELKAQGYMLGNCAHCHNPRGFPTSVSPELTDLLNFWPDAQKGGIFQFPLDRYSPRIFRGPNQNIPIPYITPSLFDLPSGYNEPADAAAGPSYKLRIVDDWEFVASFDPVKGGGRPAKERNGADGVARARAFLPVEAPWRSLIYRNVDSPFSYDDDSTIFPHMPRHTPGYDCRIRKLMGDWMVSIVARWQTQQSEKQANSNIALWPEDLTGRNSETPGQLGQPVNPELMWRYYLPGRFFEEFARNPNGEGLGDSILYMALGAKDARKEAAYGDPQPYAEVRPGESGYLSANIEADNRLARWRNSARLTHCVNQGADVNLHRDVVDPLVLRGERATPSPEHELSTPGPARDGMDAGVEPKTEEEREYQVTYVNGLVPERSHWFIADPTEAASAYQPRRADWQDILVNGKTPLPNKAEGFTDQQKQRWSQERKTVYLLTGKDVWAGRTALADDPKIHELPAREPIRMSDGMRKLALTPFPLGLWQDKPECSCRLKGEARISDARFAGAARPRWFDHASVDADGYHAAPSDGIVYSVPPGAQVFNSVCANCHGPKADSRGRMADTILDLTGGETRVANLRDGFFGPPDAAGSSRKAVFGLAPSPLGSAEDWAARYLLWMGLGGTVRTIPQSVLNVVATTRVFGLKRGGLESLGTVGANMLAVPEYLCKTVPAGGPFDVAHGEIRPDAFYPVAPGGDGNNRLPFFGTNGDLELWERLCAGEAPFPFVTLVAAVDTNGDGKPDTLNGGAGAHYLRSRYPAGTSVGDRGQIRASLSSDNARPWCLDTRNNSDVVMQLYQAGRAGLGDTGPAPVCPTALFSDENKMSDEEFEFWARRGAMNAGLAVFYYLDAVSKGEMAPFVEYDQCQKLPETRSCGGAP